jgi:ssDNA-binding Zn-finger/Zn-ribbon topoisomerase 1
MQDLPSARTLIRPPPCPDCRKPMRMTMSRHNKTLFVCNCGPLSDRVAPFKRIQLRWEMVG